MSVKAFHRSKSSRSTVGTALGASEMPPVQPPLSPKTGGLPLYCFHCAYLWCIFNFVSSSPPSLTLLLAGSLSLSLLGDFTGRSTVSLMRGINTTPLKPSPHFLAAFFF